jgi:hypothetical protein
MKKRDWMISVLSGLILGITALLAGFSGGLAPTVIGRASSDTDKILTLVLNSHNTWQTVKGEAKVVWYGPKGDTQTYLSSFEVIQPNQALIETTSVDGLNPSGVWISDGFKAYNLNPANKTYSEEVLPKFTQDFSILPKTLDQVKTNSINNYHVIYNNPFALVIPVPIREYLYPEWFAQGTGNYDLVGTDSVAGRNVWVVSCITETSIAKAWIDQGTGIILKFTQETNSQKVVEVIFTSLSLDVPVDPQIFTLPSGYQLTK